MISRTGRYRAFPDRRHSGHDVGLLLLSRLDVGTAGGVSALYLLVLGLGLGSTMQVLVLAVQNAVSFKVLGAATSGVTLFRGIGGSLGRRSVRDDLQLHARFEPSGPRPSGPIARQVGAGGG